MHKVLLDTDVLSEVLKGNNAAIARKARAYRIAFETYTTSVVTVMEIISGWVRRSDDENLSRFLNTAEKLEVLPLDPRAAEWAGRIHGHLARDGETIGRADPPSPASRLPRGYRWSPETRGTSSGSLRAATR